MRALRHHKDGLKIDDVPIPTPGPKQVLIKVRATSITANELEWTETGERSSPIPGHDVAGTVAGLGAEVTGFAEGDEVFALTSFSRDGAAADYMIAASAEPANKPTSLSFEHAAAIPLSALTIWQALFRYAEAKPGQKILITGAGGGVGVMAVQVARWASLLISGTCSAAKRELVQSLGASETFDYNKVSLDELSHDYDIVIDTVGRETLPKCFDLLKGGGKLVSIARPFTDDEKARRPDVNAVFFIVEPDGGELTEILKLCEQGFIQPVLQEVMPLEEGARAFDKLAGGHTKGKIVLKIA